MNTLSDLAFPSLSDKECDEQLPLLQQELARLQIALFQQKKRAVIVFEGTDAAGKGGAIRRMIHAMDPRGYRVYPIGPPSPAEAERHYLQRFWQRIPKNGQLGIFDRSWYGRVLVERIENFASEREWQRAYREINDFERLLVDDGIILIKLFLHISKEEQQERFTRRWTNPDKQWKLTHDDLKAHAKYDDYTEAFEEMFQRTSTGFGPWQIVPANDKDYARVTVLTKIVEGLSEKIDLSDAIKPSDKMVKDVQQLLQIEP